MLTKIIIQNEIVWDFMYLLGDSELIHETYFLSGPSPSSVQMSYRLKTVPQPAPLIPKLAVESSRPVDETGPSSHPWSEARKPCLRVYQSWRRFVMWMKTDQSQLIISYIQQ